MVLRFWLEKTAVGGSHRPAGRGRRSDPDHPGCPRGEGAQPSSGQTAPGPRVGRVPRARDSAPLIRPAARGPRPSTARATSRDARRMRAGRAVLTLAV
jgi:hypothetical protein